MAVFIEQYQVFLNENHNSPDRELIIADTDLDWLSIVQGCLEKDLGITPFCTLPLPNGAHSLLEGNVSFISSEIFTSLQLFVITHNITKVLLIHHRDQPAGQFLLKGNEFEYHKGVLRVTKENLEKAIPGIPVAILFCEKLGANKPHLVQID